MVLVKVIWSTSARLRRVSHAPVVPLVIPDLQESPRENILYNDTTNEIATPSDLLLHMGDLTGVCWKLNY